MAEPIVGIVGGMGPESTTDLMNKIFAATPARSEQDHIHLIVDSNPKTPDRTQFILGQGPSPVTAICEGLRRVARAGADLIVIPCNTAHVFIEELRAATPVPIVDLVATCAEEARRLFEPGSKIGVLATTGTVTSGLYDKALSNQRLVALKPEQNGQEALMEAIYGPRGIKAGYLEPNALQVRQLGRRLIERGCRAVVAGCTEVALVLKDCEYPVLDPVDLLARKVVQMVKGLASDDRPT